MRVTTIHKSISYVLNLKLRVIFILFIIILPFFSLGCKATTSSVKGTDQLIPELADYSSGNIEDLLIVDCLLPGKIKRMGAMTYVAPRRAVKTTALTCRIRGGEYVAYDRSNYEKALSDFDESTRLKPDNPLPYHNRTLIYFDRKDYKRAFEEYKKAIELYDIEGKDSNAFVFSVGMKKLFGKVEGEEEIKASIKENIDELGKRLKSQGKLKKIKGN